MLESLFATLAAKLAASGIAVAMAATGGLAGTGNLPDPAQAAVSEALSKVGISVPGVDADAEARTAVEAEDLDADLDADLNADGEENGEEGEPNENASFGQGVAADARDGGVDGEEIAARARAMAEERKAAGQANRPADAGRPASSVDAEASADAGPPAGAGTQAQIGLEKADDTPAAGFIPGFVKGGPGKPAGTPGR